MASPTQSDRASERPSAEPARRDTKTRMSTETRAVIALAGVGIAVLASFEEIRIYDPRILNPAPDRSQFPNSFLGISDGVWCNVIIIMAALVGVGMFTIFYRSWRRTGRMHPGVAIYIACTTIALFDPIFNWAMFACYNPKMLHVPVDWAYFDISPTVEPLWVVPGYAFFYLTPAMLAVALCRRWTRRQARRGTVARRRELWVLFATGTAIGMAWDAAVESVMINMGIWQYWRYWGPALVTGPGGNSHLPITEIVMLGVTAGICGVMMHQDDRGQSFALRLANRFTMRSPLLARRKGLAEIMVATVLIDAFFTAYIGFYAVLRVADQESTISGHWHFPSIKVYDPDGAAAAAGIPGPYFEGVWPLPRPDRPAQ